MTESAHTFSITFELDEDGMFIAECIDLQGCHAHGVTKDEARAQLREVIALHLEVLASQGKTVPHVEIETLDIAV